jgi:hypothetical protein
MTCVLPTKVVVRGTCVPRVRCCCGEYGESRAKREGGGSVERYAGNSRGVSIQRSGMGKGRECALHIFSQRVRDVQRK